MEMLKKGHISGSSRTNYASGRLNSAALSASTSMGEYPALDSLLLERELLREKMEGLDQKVREAREKGKEGQGRTAGASGYVFCKNRSKD